MEHGVRRESAGDDARVLLRTPADVGNHRHVRSVTIEDDLHHSQPPMSVRPAGDMPL